MSLGLGHRYWVHLIDHFYGTLEECLDYINKNKPSTKYQWYELRPQIKVLKEGSYCEGYCADLVEEAK